MSDTVVTKEFRKSGNGEFYSIVRKDTTGLRSQLETIIQLGWLPRDIEIPETAKSLWFEFSRKKRAGSIPVELRAYDMTLEVENPLAPPEWKDGRGWKPQYTSLYSSEIVGGLAKALKILGLKCLLTGNSKRFMRVLYTE